MRALVMTFALMTPQITNALSCQPYSVESAYVKAAAAEESYVVVQGTLHFDARKLPKVDFDRQGDTPPMTLIPAELRGKALSGKGFAVPFEREVTLAVACFGPWCAQVPSKTEVLAFVQRGPGGYVVAANPCGGFLFPDPKPAMLRAVKDCFAGKACVPLER